MQHVLRMLAQNIQLCGRIPVRPVAASRRSFTARAVQMASAESEPSTSGRVDGRPLLSVAPMMDWTDVHFRQLARIISKRTWLWTEMVVDKTIIHSPLLDKHLWFPPEQHPLVLQLGGSDPELLLQASSIAARYGYDEINLNCGCPSDRVAGAGCFGAALMLQPELVADCMAAVAAGAGPNTPVSVKCRLGVDDTDSYEQLHTFVSIVSSRGGVRNFIIHTRKCLLKGLSPAQNRTVPPLRHDWVWALKRDFPHLSFQLNGGILSSYSAQQILEYDAGEQHGVPSGAVDGVMLGRAAYHDPWGVLGDADVAVFGAETNPAVSRRQVIAEYCTYADAMIGRWQVKDDGYHDPNIRVLVKPILNLFHGDRGGKRWKNAVDGVLKAGGLKSVTELMDKTLIHIPDEILDAPPKTAEQAALISGNGSLPVPFVLPDRLPQFEDRARGDRARGDNERRRGKQQQQHGVPEQQQQPAQQQQQQNGNHEQLDGSQVVAQQPVQQLAVHHDEASQACAADANEYLQDVQQQQQRRQQPVAAAVG